MLVLLLICSTSEIDPYLISERASRQEDQKLLKAEQISVDESLSAHPSQPQETHFRVSYLESNFLDHHP